MVSWDDEKRAGLRHTAVVELDAPQEDGDKDGIGRPFLLDDEGADNQEAGGDVYPVKVLARKQRVGHVEGFFLGVVPQQNPWSRCVDRKSRPTGSGDVCLYDDDRSWATGTSIGSPGRFLRAVSRSTSPGPKSQQKVVIGEVWADFLPAVADFLPGRVSGAPNLGPSFSPSPGKSRLVPQPPPQGSRSPSDARLFPSLF